MKFQIGKFTISPSDPTFFIADVAANHDGDLERAKDLIYMAAEAGADAAKFQHFAAETIVSDYGFKHLGTQQSHQASWKKSVFEVYKDASLNVNWTPILKETCDKAGIVFFTSPYSFELVDAVDQYIPAYKIGSGDITWLEMIKYMGKKGKPLLLATGAATFDEVRIAMDVAQSCTKEIVLMQCNTNYTGSLENFKYINLNVLKIYKEIYPDVVLGLSDHTPGHTTVLGAVALGARVIEKHFTDDRKRIGPDHGFSMDPSSWKEMVERIREMELSLGNGIKRVEENEEQTVVLQRRAIRLKRQISKDSVLNRDDLEVLRPCPQDGLPPYFLDKVIGKKASRDMTAGEHVKWSDLN
ncbi:MAG: N-acetylneuraminate synthase [Fibrobacter sp.]|nr:N-acetylneuraminate synthase [Fibrobacter sp.]